MVISLINIFNPCLWALTWPVPNVKLLFFADCIGSAFNMKGAMQCPNCRKVEKGQWLYANGSSCSFPEFNMEDWIPDEDPYDLSYAEMVITSVCFLQLVASSLLIAKKCLNLS